MLLWAERYDRMLDDVFVLQDEIAGQITGTVEPELGFIEFAALRGQSATDMDAWNIYLKGLWHLYKFDLENLRISKELFERAIDLEPLLPRPMRALLMSIYSSAGMALLRSGAIGSPTRRRWLNVRPRSTTVSRQRIWHSAGHGHSAASRSVGSNTCATH